MAGAASLLVREQWQWREGLVVGLSSGRGQFVMGKAEVLVEG